MGVGFETYDSAGRLQVTSDVTSYVLTGYGTGNSISRIDGNTTPSSCVVPLGSSGSNRVIAVKCLSGMGMNQVGTYGGSPSAIYACAGAVGTAFSYYIFEPAAALSSVHGTGVEVRNSAGVVTFSTAYRTMQVVGVLAYQAKSGFYWDSYYSNASTVTVSGRTLAYAQGGFAGHRIHPAQMICYQGGSPHLDTGSCTDYRYNNNGKIYGAFVNSTGDTCTTAEISYDDVQVSNGSSNVFPPDYVTPIKLFVIDVTNINGGSVYTPPATTKTATLTGSTPETYSDTAGTKQFLQRFVNITGGTASSYAWSITSPTNGSWNFYAGGASNNDNATPQVTGVAAQATATANLSCVVTFSDATTATSNAIALQFTNTSAAATVSVAMSPGNQSTSGTATSTTFSAETVTVTNGTASNYAWTVVSSSPPAAVFSLANASTATATPSVTGVANATTATATIQCVTTVAGTNYTNSCTLSYQNTSAAGGAVTFSPVPGTYSYTDSSPIQITTSPATSVTWTWTRTGNLNGVTTPASGTAATSMTMNLTTGLSNRTSTWNVTASGAASGTWTITDTETGTSVCVVLDTFVPRLGRARWVKVGDYLDIADPVTFAERQGLVSKADHAFAECVRITTRTGIELECTTSAPIAVEGGSMIEAPYLLGYSIPVRDNGVWGHDEVISVEPIGVREITHITCEDDLFLAGKHDGRYVLHHNLKA